MSAVATGQPSGRTTPAEQALLDARYGELAARDRLLPIKVPAFYQLKLDQELAALGHTEGPLHRMVRPTRDRFTARAGHEVADWVDDRSNMPVPGSQTIIHKYADRVLFMPTSVCAGHCQYCFRQDVLTDAHADERAVVVRELDHLVAYLGSKPEVSEVILSGGDPLTLPLRDLELIFRRLRALPQIRSIRIHSRTLAFAPKIFGDPAKIDLLAEADVRLVFHFAHPYEVCDDVREVLSRLAARRIRLYNHFPLLRGVNDHVDVLRRLVEDLDDARVRTLSVYLPEPIHHSAPYRLTLDRILALQDALTASTPSWINAIRFTLDSPVGKARREHITAWDRATGRVTFEKDGKSFVYPDFPSELDVPGERDVLLWRG
ncbi:radical SAM protein [Oryzibacter oryziterrae]|uniref:radical SAM protein n=1 Tax=Oryzibacter oryziterrae TaxID=2766474 RepID=UPI001F007CCB|nr:radical SAM protein [Oryzibacter oryziterrae]